MPLILALWRQRQEDLCEFKASLVYRGSSRTARDATQRNPVSKNKMKQKNSKAGEMAQWLGSLAVLTEEQSSVPISSRSEPLIPQF